MTPEDPRGQAPIDGGDGIQQQLLADFGLRHEQSPHWRSGDGHGGRLLFANTTPLPLSRDAIAEDAERDLAARRPADGVLRCRPDQYASPYGWSLRHNRGASAQATTATQQQQLPYADDADPSSAAAWPPPLWVPPGSCGAAPFAPLGYVEPAVDSTAAGGGYAAGGYAAGGYAPPMAAWRTGEAEWPPRAAQPQRPAPSAQRPAPSSVHATRRPH